MPKTAPIVADAKSDIIDTIDALKKRKEQLEKLSLNELFAQTVEYHKQNDSTKKALYYLTALQKKLIESGSEKLPENEHYPLSQIASTCLYCLTEVDANIAAMEQARAEKKPLSSKAFNQLVDYELVLPKIYFFLSYLIKHAKNTTQELANYYLQKAWAITLVYRIQKITGSFRPREVLHFQMKQLDANFKQSVAYDTSANNYYKCAGMKYKCGFYKEAQADLKIAEIKCRAAIARLATDATPLSTALLLTVKKDMKTVIHTQAPMHPDPLLTRITELLQAVNQHCNDEQTSRGTIYFEEVTTYINQLRDAPVLPSTAATGAAATGTATASQAPKNTMR